MVEKIKNIPTRLLDRWKKFTNKQRILIISAVAVVIVILILVIALLGKTNYTLLTTVDTTQDASTVVNLLKEQGIDYKLSDDQLNVYVDEKKKQNAVLLLAEHNMPSTGLTIEALLDNSLSTTTDDRNLKVNLYYQDKLRNILTSMEGITDAQVTYIPNSNSQSLWASEQITTASVTLTTDRDFKASTANSIAEIVASTIGNKTTDGIKVIDQYGNLLFGGPEDLYSGTASSNEDYRERLRNTFKNNLYGGLLKAGYDDVEIMVNLKLDMDKVNELYTEYTPAEGLEQGLYSHSYVTESQGMSGSGGVAGTASNDETSYQVPDGDGMNTSQSTAEYDYTPNTRVTNTEYEVGAIDKEESTVGIVLTNVKTYSEEDLRLLGLLEDMTYDEYVLKNNAKKPIEVGDNIYELVSKATGLSIENIRIDAFEQPVFVPTVKTERSITDYLPYILAGLIILLLLFIVIRTAAPVEVVETEPELSVEELLATTKENQTIDDIEFDDKSETRKMIEKFVDENPDAVANLLRNWLNEDWD